MSEQTTLGKILDDYEAHREREVFRLRAENERLKWALQQFVDYYDQAGIGDCEEGHDDDDDGFGGDEHFNVRIARAALRREG